MQNLCQDGSGHEYFARASVLCTDCVCEKLLMAASAGCAGAIVGTIAAGFAILFIKIHRVLERVVKATGLHVGLLLLQYWPSSVKIYNCCIS